MRVTEKSLRIPIITSITILLISSLPVLAQDSAEQDFFDESPLVLTASRMSKPLLESPASVSVIDREMIETSGVRELADLFRLVPGFIVGYHSGHSPAVSYHGLGQEFSRNIQVLIDGRSVFIPSFGGVPWSNLPLLIEDIERIEVIRGPNAVTYGANAFLATINIITRHAAEDQGGKYSVNLSDNSNPDIEDAYLRIGRQHEDVDWRLSLGAVNDEGFASINDSKRVAKFNFRADIAATGSQLWTLQTGSSDSVAGRGSEENLTDLERFEEATNSYLNLQWEGVRDSSTTIVRLTHTRQQVSDSYDPGPITFNGFNGVTTFIDFDRNSQRTDLEVIQTDDIGENLRLVYGGSLRQDRVKSLFLLNDNQFHDVDTNSLFGGLEWRFDPDWLLDVGVMLQDSSLTSSESSPRISLIRKIGEDHALRLVASSALRNPILYESEGETEFVANIPGFGTVIVPTWMGNDEIESEEIESYEIGLRSQIGSDLNSDIRLFQYEIDNHILASRIDVDTGPPLGVVSVDTTANDENTEVRGVDLSIEYSPGDQYELHAGISVIDVDSGLETLQDSYAENTGFLGAQYRIDQAQEISAVFYYVDAISWIDSGSDIPIMRRLDLRYVYRLDNQTRIELIGQNLLEDFEDYEPENEHDQVVYLRFTGGF